jgi:phospholipase C
MRAIWLVCWSTLLASCDPQAADWGLEAIRTMQTPPDDPGLGCGAEPPIDTNAAARARCEVPAGTHAAAALGTSTQALAEIPIRHVIVLMRENRSFDHLFGKLHERGQPGVEPVPETFSNPDRAGVQVFPGQATSTCIATDPGHQSESMQRCVHGGKMDGFVLNAAATTPTDGHFVMDYYDESELPFYYWLARTFAVSDRHFAPNASGTFANRAFLVFATNAGVVDTGIVFPPPNTPSLFHLLMNAGFTWGAYSDGLPFSGSLDWDHTDAGVHHLQELYDALDRGTLPNVAFVDGVEDLDDDHPAADLQLGEARVKSVYEHALTSPEWQHLAIFWTYDEAGAFADHVPPPRGCLPLPSRSPFAELGPRVPLVAISPWAKRGYASHVVHDHSAITRFIEAIFDLPSLTARDANSDALLDLFDFSCARDLSLPPAPDVGSGGCPRLQSARN